MAANRLAVALSPHFDVSANTMLAAFLAPDMRRLYVDWDAMTAKAVAFLRSVIVGRDDDPAITTLVGELSTSSDRFRTLWAKHDVQVRDHGVTSFQHPGVGRLDLRYQKFVLPEAGHLLVTYHAEPGGASHDSLHRLADMPGRRTGDR